MFLPYQDYATVFMSTGLSCFCRVAQCLAHFDTLLLSHKAQVLCPAIKIANALPPCLKPGATRGVDNLVSLLCYNLRLM